MQSLPRGIILGVPGLASCVLPAAAQTPGPAAKVRLEIGDIPANDQSVRWFSAQVDSFRAAHPEIEIVTFGIGGDPRARRPIATLSDLPENIVGIESMPGGEAAFLAERDLIVPIKRFLPDPQFSLDVFDRNLYDSVTYDGKIWGIPWYAEGNSLVYDPAMLKEAGIQRPPETWDELMTDVEKLGKDANGDGRLEQYSLRIGNKNTLLVIWIFLLLQQGINVMDDSGFHFGGEAPRQAFDLLQQLAASPKVRKSEPNPSEPCAFSFETSRSIGRPIRTMPNQRFQIAPVPGFGSHKSMRSRTVYLCVRKSTPEREAASWEFIKWLVRKDAPFLCEADMLEGSHKQAVVAQTLKDEFAPFERLLAGVESAATIPSSLSAYLVHAPNIGAIEASAAADETEPLDTARHLGRIQRLVAYGGNLDRTVNLCREYGDTLRGLIETNALPDNALAFAYAQTNAKAECLQRLLLDPHFVRSAAANSSGSSASMRSEQSLGDLSLLSLDTAERRFEKK